MLIIHRCTSCRCPDLFAAGPQAMVAAGYPRQGIPARSLPAAMIRRGCEHQLPRADHHAGQPCVYGPPELMHEWDSRTGDEITEVRSPGYIGFGTRTCDCDACRRFHREHTGEDTR